jgi:four helix bundle protein
MDAGTRQDIKERTFSFAAEVVRFCDPLHSRRGAVRTLGRQLLRAGTSIGANVEEAQAGQSRADFVSKYSIALKEARETIYWLRLLKITRMCTDAQPEKLRNEAEQIARIIGSIIVSTKKTNSHYSCSFLLFPFYFLPFTFFISSSSFSGAGRSDGSRLRWAKRMFPARSTKKSPPPCCRSSLP